MYLVIQERFSSRENHQTSEMLQFLRISRIPKTFSQYPVSQYLFPQISRTPVIFSANIPYPENP